MNKKILIIEDEDEFFFFYTMMLEGSDYIVNRATDGKQAFQKIREDRPDLIILDLLLDQMACQADCPGYRLSITFPVDLYLFC